MTGSCLAVSAINRPPILSVALSSRFSVGHLKPSIRPPKSRFRRVECLVLVIQLCHPLFGVLLGLTGATCINLAREFCGWREHGHDIIQDLSITPTYRQIVPGHSLFITHLAGDQKGKKSNVIRQHAELSQSPGGCDLIDHIIEHKPARCHHSESDFVSHLFSTTKRRFFRLTRARPPPFSWLFLVPAQSSPPYKRLVPEYRHAYRQPLL